MGKPNSLLAFLLALSAFLGQAYGQLPIAVLDLEGKGISKIEASVLTDKLRTELHNTQHFAVIERAKMEEVLKEQGFQQTGCTSSECVVEAGQLIGVERMVAGSVGKVGSMFLVTIRMIDVQLGKIDKIVEEKITGKIEDVLEFGITNVARKMAGLAPTKVFRHVTANPIQEKKPDRELKIMVNGEYRGSKTWGIVVTLFVDVIGLKSGKKFESKNIAIKKKRHEFVVKGIGQEELEIVAWCRRSNEVYDTHKETKKAKMIFPATGAEAVLITVKKKDLRIQRF